jgi:hypothetical protein
MHGLWDRAYFADVHDYPSWERELLEDADIERHIAEGHFVPINIGSDGAWLITLRADTDQMPDLKSSEANRVLVRSGPYLFRSRGYADFSGIEYVNAQPAALSVASMVIPAGDYEARVHLLDWGDVGPTERGADFVVLLGPASASDFRTAVSTFDRPG